MGISPTKISLCIPLTEPARLIYAAGVCQIWWEVISNGGFCRAYHRRYPRPPLLGFFDETSRFVPANSVCPSWSPVLGNATGMVLNCRHGCVLLHRKEHTAETNFCGPLWSETPSLETTTPSFSYQFFTGAVIKMKSWACSER
ncbi:hypothetical protein C2845_PM07G02180 [Panicum miliaceum]|uniref:F-box domain-containing protein n=1 Tax=Panicum miliaceum TaxID=4540 RepID=A0A3L6SQP9_PANMI|nr:hypothetical protein C2845_PM07G02180 [Panicum miliaceum]